MWNPSEPGYARVSLASLRPIAQERFLKTLTLPEARILSADFSEWAGPGQVPPEEPSWRTWLFLGGRGSGKTRAGAEWVNEQVKLKRARRVALIAPTFHDAREVMIEGPSGLFACGGAKPKLELTRRRLLWPNGAEAFFYSSEDPESLRGPQFDAAWGDELAYWTYPEAAFETLAHALRLGERPRLALTTTPRPMPLLRRLVGAKDVAVTRARTFDNGSNLAPGFVEALLAAYKGTLRDRQELDGELIDDPPGALWKRGEIEAARAEGAEDYDRVVVAVDPPAGAGPGADACGIVAAGACGWGLARRATVLADASVQGLAPLEWARRAAWIARSLKADAIVAEANNGGELVRTMLRLAAPDMAIRLVYASRGKRSRAEPIHALYAAGRVTHAATFAALEDEMCSFGAPGFRTSPDRLDALVWALTDLLLQDADPRLRRL